MDDEYADKAVKLLDVIYKLYGSENGYPFQKIPFTVNEEGVVALSQELLSELTGDENGDLLVWARENIVRLFE